MTESTEDSVGCTGAGAVSTVGAGESTVGAGGLTTDVTGSSREDTGSVGMGGPPRTGGESVAVSAVGTGRS